MFTIHSNKPLAHPATSHPQSVHFSGSEYPPGSMAGPAILSLSNPRSYHSEHSLARHDQYPSHHDAGLVRESYSSSRHNQSGTIEDSRTISSSVDLLPHSGYRAGYPQPSHVQMSNDIQYHSRDQGPSTILPSVSQLRRGDTPAVVDTSLGAHDMGYPPEPSSATTVHSSAHSSAGESGSWSPSPKDSIPDLSRPRKPRREKPRIDLAPDQPPTTQGKPRARVYVACVQCRTRKIRCDGAKPVCHNCSRRTTGGNECSYDAVPKRRGPDKTPGARQRMARDVRNEIDDSIIPGRRRRRRRDDVAASDLHNASQRVDISDPARQSRSRTTSILPMISLAPPATSGTADSQNDALPAPHPSHPTDTSYIDTCGYHGSLQCQDQGHLLENAGPIQLPLPFNDSFTQESEHLSATHYGGFISRGYITQLDENGNEVQDDGNDIASEPSLDFTRKIWWDSLLSLYSSPTSNRLQNLTPSQRDLATQHITSDLRFLFRASNYWFAFFHVPSFFGNYFDPIRRERIQPSLILAALAMSTFFQSSEVGNGRDGRERALRFRDEAQSAMEASFNAGWIDETLAQAAWLLALFEVCAHPYHSTERSTSSMTMLDSIIRSLSLTLVDADDPHASVFTPRSVPAVPERSHRSSWSPEPLVHSHHIVPSNVYPSHPQPISHPHPRPQDTNNGMESGCSCKSLTLGQHWSPASEHTPLWASTPAWNSAWSEGEIRKESCRRLCWSSMILAAGHISYTTANKTNSLNLFIADPANYALLFSGESITRSPSLSSPHSSKDTIWALYDRSFLLWHGCMRMRNDPSIPDVEKAQFAVSAWLEADALEDALNKHTCGIERAFIFQGREYLFNTRMTISYEFQRFIPLVTANVNGLFHRKKAEEWLSHQATVAQRFMYGLHTITGNITNLLARRPFFVFWFMGQISRALTLWQCDNTMTVALEVCKAFLPPIDYLTALWPCAEQRYRYERLRERLSSACYAAGLPPLSPPNLTIPPPSSPEALV